MRGHTLPAAAASPAQDELAHTGAYEAFLAVPSHLVRVYPLVEGIELAWDGNTRTACVGTYNERMACGDWLQEQVASPGDSVREYKVRMRRMVDVREAFEIDAAALVEQNIL